MKRRLYTKAFTYAFLNISSDFNFNLKCCCGNLIYIVNNYLNKYHVVMKIFFLMRLNKQLLFLFKNVINYLHTNQ